MGEKMTILSVLAFGLLGFYKVQAEVGVYYSISSGPPTGTTECGTGGYWANESSTENIGGDGSEFDPGHAILEGGSGSNAIDRCFAYYHLTSRDTSWEGTVTVERWVVVTAWMNSNSNELAISDTLCQELCPGSRCGTDGPLGNCEVTVNEHVDKTSTTTIAGQSTTPSSSSSTSSSSTSSSSSSSSTISTSSTSTIAFVPDAQVYLWQHATCATSCGGRLNWNTQCGCGGAQKPCFAKLNGNFEFDVEDTNGETAEVGCGDILVITGIDGVQKHIQIVEREDANASALGVAEAAFLPFYGSCPYLCKSGDCVTTPRLCPAEVFEDCDCEDVVDGSDLSCKVCDVCSNKVSGLVRGIVTGRRNVVVKATIVGHEAVGAAREFGVIAGLSAVTLLVL